VPLLESGGIVAENFGILQNADLALAGKRTRILLSQRGIR
jgi:hypothetical protein